LDEENSEERKELRLTEVRNVVVVGSGPAGLTAAIYTARANLSPLVVEGELSSTTDQPGGQLMLTTDVENYPGFVDGIMGPELMANFRAQAARFGAEFLTDKVTRVDFSSRPYGLWVGDPDAPEPSYRTSSVIVATGARSLMLGLPKEEDLLGHGLSTCATCDGFFFRGQRIGVVGGGDSAIEEAIFLTRFAEKVTILHRRDQLRASKIMQERAFKNDKVDFVWNVRVAELVGDGRFEGVVLEDVQTGERSDLELGGLFVAIGHRPNTDLFRGVLDMDEAGYLVTQPGSTATNVPGVFASGDVQDHTYRQAITAAGSGCMAAIDAERWLEATGAAPPDIAETPTDW
jgi:thioredoxin reductase (NADPH)